MAPYLRGRSGRTRGRSGGDRPSGADAEHMQPSKTINSKAQRKKREDKRRKKMALKFNEDTTSRNAIINILQRNSAVENKVKSATGAAIGLDDVTAASLDDAKVATFLSCNAKELTDFIHVRKFNDATFHKSKLTGADGKLNRTVTRTQTAESIEQDCSEGSPCLVWLAWRLRSHPIVLEIPPEPILIAPTVPEFNVVYAGPATTKPASDFFKDIVWVENWERIVKGVGSIAITDELMGKADSLALSMAARLDLHIDDRVDKSRHSHWTLQFTRDNLPPMAAAMCLAGHIVDDIDTYDINECLLRQPTDEIFQVASGNLGKLEGCARRTSRQGNRTRNRRAVLHVRRCR